MENKIKLSGSKILEFNKKAYADTAQLVNNAEPESNIKKTITALQTDPELLNEMIEMEEYSGFTFKQNWSLKNLKYDS